MNLKLLNAEKAVLFGLPARDLTGVEALAALAEQGCPEPAAMERIADAIAAGAFAVEDPGMVKPKEAPTRVHTLKEKAVKDATDSN